MRLRLKKSEVFLIIGLSIGITIFSIGVSYINGMKNMNSLGSINDSDYARFSISSNAKISEVIPKVIKSIDDLQMVARISINNNSKTITYNGVTQNNDMLIKDISSEETINKNEIIAGNGLKSEVYTSNQVDYLKINGKEFKVIDYLDNNKSSYSIYMNMDDFIRCYSEDFMVNVSFTCIQKDINKDKIINTINKSLSEGEEAHILKDYNKDSSSNLLIYMSYIVLIVSSINIINFTLLWMNSRKREIAIYKTYGARENDIFRLLFNELVSLGFVAVIFSLLVQAVIDFFVNHFTTTSVYMEISKENVLYALAISLLLTFIATIPSYIESRKVQPAIILKEE